MKKKVVRRGVSKAQWLEAGLSKSTQVSIGSISIEDIAKDLGIAKSGFYWHFKNRDELFQEMLDYWIHEITEVITENQELQAMHPKARLIATAEMVFDYQLARWELAMRQWAVENDAVARTVTKANRMRLNFLLAAFQELGFKGEDAEMRAMTLLAYVSWDMHMFGFISRKKRRSMISSRIDLLTTPTS